MSIASKMESGQLSMPLTLHDLGNRSYICSVDSTEYFGRNKKKYLTEIGLWMRCSMEATMPLDWDRWCVLFALVHIVPYLSGYNRFFFFFEIGCQFIALAGLEFIM